MSGSDETLTALLKALAESEGESTDPADIKAMMRDLKKAIVEVPDGMLAGSEPVPEEGRKYIAKTVPGYDGEPDIEEVEVCATCEEETCVCVPEPTIHDMLNDGLTELFGGLEGPLNREIAWLSDPKHVKEDPKIQGRFEQKAVVRVGHLSLDSIDDMMFFLDQCTRDTCAWYWWRSKEALVKAAGDRLVVLAEEEKEEQADQDLMDAAMAAKEEDSE